MRKGKDTYSPYRQSRPNKVLMASGYALALSLAAWGCTPPGHSSAPRASTSSAASRAPGSPEASPQPSYDSAAQASVRNGIATLLRHLSQDSEGGTLLKGKWIMDQGGTCDREFTVNVPENNASGAPNKAPSDSVITLWVRSSYAEPVCLPANINTVRAIGVEVWTTDDQNGEATRKTTTVTLENPLDSPAVARGGTVKGSAEAQLATLPPREVPDVVQALDDISLMLSYPAAAIHLGNTQGQLQAIVTGQ